MAQEEQEEEREKNESPAGTDDPSLEEDQESEPAEEEQPERRGCVSGCLIPVAAVIVIALVIGAIGYQKRDALSHYLLKGVVANTQDDVLYQNDTLSAPIDMSQDEIKALFKKVKLALKEGRIDAEVLREVIEEYWDVAGKRPSPRQRREGIEKFMANLSAMLTQSNSL